MSAVLVDDAVVHRPPQVSLESAFRADFDRVEISERVDHGVLNDVRAIILEALASKGGNAA